MIIRATSKGAQYNRSSGTLRGDFIRSRPRRGRHSGEAGSFPGTRVAFIANQAARLYIGSPNQVTLCARKYYQESIISNSEQQKVQLPGVRHIIAVASGKGGVGKSTVSANLALALAVEGHRVALLDADIYGPSQGMMMGVGEDVRPEVTNQLMVPVVAHNVQCMSMSFITDTRTATVWRGPMASGALQQLLSQTRWDDVEYLIVDMPPGTGDIQLTLAQQVPLSGAVIVTTPQDIALLDACKGVEMFRKVSVPVLGIIENMSTHICSNCGHEEAIFGAGGGARIAADYDTELLGQLPLSMDIREQSDGGKPPLVSDPDGEVSQVFRKIAVQLVERVSASTADAPTIKIVDD